MKLKCEICDGGENFECEEPFAMIKHLEQHNKALELLIEKLIKDKQNEKKI